MKVAFIGHREIENIKGLKERLTNIVEGLILNEGADTFLFGSRSKFDKLSHKVVTQLKKKYPQIRRIYVRAEYEYIDKLYTDYLMTFYDETYFPAQVHGAGALSYIKRNREMVDTCDILVIFYNVNYIPNTKNRSVSGTKLAVEYAIKKNKRIINLFE